MASYTDYLWTSTGGAVTILGGLWVRLHNNNTGTDYYSSAVTDASTGAFTHSAPTGDYSLYSGTAATVGGTPNLRNGHYAVAARSGDDPAFNSATVVGGTYTPSALALAGGQIWGTKVIQGPPPSGGDDTTTLTNLVAGGGLVLRLQPGTYNWSSIITLASNALIQGAGAGATILNWTGGNVSGGNAALEVPNTTSDVGFQDLTIQGAAATGANNGKLVRLGGTRSALIRCTINQTGNSSIDGAAIFFNSYTTVTIRDCTILSAGAYTVRFNSSVGASTDFRFTNNRVSNSNAAAAGGLVHFDGAGGAGFTDILIADNYLGPCTGHNGVLMQNNYSRINCSRNNVKLCTRMGIEISNGTTEVVIDGNDIDYTGVTTATGWPISAGIGTASPTGYTISDNIINGANVPGVAYGIEGGSDMTIIGNTIINIEAGQPIGVNGSGIIIANNPNCTIVCNALQNIGGTGIKIYGGASGGQNSNNTTIVGNVIKKAGQGSTSAAATIAGISLEPGSGTVTNCTVVGNTIDTVGTPVGASGPAGITWSTSGNHIGANNITGVSPLYSRGGSPVDAGGAMFGTGYSIDATGLAVFLAGMKLSGSTSGYTDELAFQSTTSSVDSAISDLLTGTASMNFDHRGTSNTGQFRWRNGTGAGTLLALLSNNGLFTTYGKTATQGQGVPAIYQAPAPSLAQTAAVTSIATITSPNDGAKHVYRISGTVTITTLGSGNIQLQVTYTDSNGTARTCQIPLCAQVGAFVASATTADDYKGVVEITVNPNTAVTVKTAGTFTGCTYNTSGQIEQIL